MLAPAVTLTPLPATVGGAAGATANLAANSVLRQAQVADAQGPLERQSNGNGVINNATVDAAAGRRASRSAGLSGACQCQSNNPQLGQLKFPHPLMKEVEIEKRRDEVLRKCTNPDLLQTD